MRAWVLGVLVVGEAPSHTPWGVLPDRDSSAVGRGPAMPLSTRAPSWGDPSSSPSRPQLARSLGITWGGEECRVPGPL